MITFAQKYVFSTDSALYIYYIWLRKLFGRSEQTEKTNLCPAVRWILFGSIGLLVLGIPMLIGGLFTKMSGMLTRRENNFSNLFVRTRLGEFIDESTDRFVQSPLMFGTIYCVLTPVVLVGICTILAAFGFITWHIAEIFTAALAIANIVGWHVLWLCHGIGCGLYWAWYGIVWFFTNGFMWAMIAKWLGLGLACLMVVGTVCVMVGYVCMAFFKSQFMEKILANWRSSREATAKAQRDREDRRAEIHERKKHWTCSYCKFVNSFYMKLCINCAKERKLPDSSWLVGKFLAAVLRIDKFFSGGVVWVGNTKVTTLGFFSVVTAFLRAKHHRICPDIYFVSPEALQAAAISSGRERLAAATAEIDRRIGEKKAKEHES